MALFHSYVKLPEGTVDSLVQLHTIYGSATCSNMETIHETCCGENNLYVMQKVEIFRIPTSITSYHYNIP